MSVESKQEETWAGDGIRKPRGGLEQLGGASPANTWVSEFPSPGCETIHSCCLRSQPVALGYRGLNSLTQQSKSERWPLLGLKSDSVHSASGVWAGGWSTLSGDRTGWGRGSENPRCTVGDSTTSPRAHWKTSQHAPSRDLSNPSLLGVRRSGLEQWFTNLAADQEAPGEL